MGQFCTEVVAWSSGRRQSAAARPRQGSVIFLSLDIRGGPMVSRIRVSVTLP